MMTKMSHMMAAKTGTPKAIRNVPEIRPPWQLPLFNSASIFRKCFTRSLVKMQKNLPLAAVNEGPDDGKQAPKYSEYQRSYPQPQRLPVDTKRKTQDPRVGNN